MKNEKLRQIYSLFCGLVVYVEENQEARESVSEFMTSCINYLTALNNRTDSHEFAIGLAAGLRQKANVLKDLIGEDYKEIFTIIMDDCINIIRKIPSILVPHPIAIDEFNDDMSELKSVKDAVTLTKKSDNPVNNAGVKREHSRETVQSSNNINTNNVSNNNNNNNNNNNSNNNNNPNNSSLIDYQKLNRANETEILNKILAMDISNAGDLKNIIHVVLDLLIYFSHNIAQLETQLKDFENSSYAIQLKDFNNSKNLKINQHNYKIRLSQLIIKFARSTNAAFLKVTHIPHRQDLNEMTNILCLALNREYVINDINIYTNLVYLLDYCINYLRAIDFFSPGKLNCLMHLLSDKISFCLVQRSYDQIPKDLQILLQTLQEAKSNHQELSDKQRQLLIDTIKAINAYIEHTLREFNANPNTDYLNKLNIIKDIIDVFLSFDKSLIRDIPEVLKYTQVTVDMYLDSLMNNALPQYLKLGMYVSVGSCANLFVQYCYLTDTENKISNMHHFLISFFRGIRDNINDAEKNKYLECIIPITKAYLSAFIGYGNNRKFNDAMNPDFILDKDRVIKEMLCTVLSCAIHIFKNNIKYNIQNNPELIKAIQTLVNEFMARIGENNDALQGRIDMDMQNLEELFKSVSITSAVSTENAQDRSNISNSNIFSRTRHTSNNNNNNNLSEDQSKDQDNKPQSSNSSSSSI